MLRLSVTDLETLRYFKSREDAPLSDLLASLAHVSPPTRKMEAGKAMASFWEHAAEGPIDSAKSCGWTINFCLDADVSVPPVREMKIEFPMLTPSGPVVLVGKVDGFEGVTVRDQKLTEKLDVESKYLDSLQWRAYLMMLEAKKFVYDVFVGNVDEYENVITVNEYHPVPFYTYPGIEGDVQRAVNELADVVTRYQSEIAQLNPKKAAKDAAKNGER